jgi:hypothetical protein
VAAGEHVGRALDVSLGQHGPDELDLGRARLRMLAGDGEDGAVVLGDAEDAARSTLDVGDVAVLVEDARQLGDLGGEGPPSSWLVSSPYAFGNSASAAAATR